ncbi:MAG: MgtC/SapB family protein [Cyanobium sp. PLM2.Bin73]|jgi:putative Mg2+ transporter-C (MgtC) family protein|nr:MAG: MgtC/SapB family protein [Cyanobium sp. PLM2.Bin73]
MLSVLTPGDASPTRVSAQVVSGIGFLAGGVILKEGLSVRGLNTAATLWCAAAIGTLCGAGFVLQATLGAVAVLLANTVLRPLSYRINQQPLENTELELCYLCSFTCRSSEEAPRSVEVEAELVTQTRDDQALEQIVSRLCLDPAVSSAHWRIIEQEFG